MRRLSTLTFVIFLLASGVAVSVEEDEHGSIEVRLCRALAEVKPGQQIPIAVTGVLKGEYFYDPDECSCPVDIQPSTLIVFDAQLPPAAVAILDRDGRLLLSAEGVLHGPVPASSSSIDLPVGLRLSQHLTSRYGIDHAFRTEFVVKSVVGFQEVPAELPWAGVVARPPNVEGMPQLEKAVLPRYPRTARRLGVQGTVILEVGIADGEVVDVEVVTAADPILGSSALEDVSTWLFKESVTARIQVTFDYVLERRTFPSDDNPRIEARLPAYVRVIGPTFHW